MFTISMYLQRSQEIRMTLLLINKSLCMLLTLSLHIISCNLLHGHAIEAYMQWHNIGYIVYSLQKEKKNRKEKKSFLFFHLYIRSVQMDTTLPLILMDMSCCTPTSSQRYGIWHHVSLCLAQRVQILM